MQKFTGFPAWPIADLTVERIASNDQSSECIIASIILSVSSGSEVGIAHSTNPGLECAGKPPFIPERWQCSGNRRFVRRQATSRTWRETTQSENLAHAIARRTPRPLRGTQRNRHSSGRCACPNRKCVRPLRRHRIRYRLLPSGVPNPTRFLGHR